MPKITSLSPASGKAGSSVRINGKNLVWQGNTEVIFIKQAQSYPAVIISKSDPLVTIEVPALTKGSYSIKVRNGLGDSSAKSLTIK